MSNEEGHPPTLEQHGFTHQASIDPLAPQKYPPEDHEHNLSELTIDADMDWAGKNITNLGAGAHDLNAKLNSIGKTNIHFCIQGTAQVKNKVIQVLLGQSITISKVKVYGDTAPTGASLIVDVNKNGTTIFTAQANRPEIAIAGHADDSGTPDVPAFVEGDRLSVDIDQVGSTEPGGNDLTVTIVVG